jgi:hypothetical protein
MRNSLILCPVGSPLSFDDRFDKENHWRNCHKNRLYETAVFAYSDFLPEANTSDFLIIDKGFKWSLAKKYIESFEFSKYEYIGFLDDDLITDIHNINLSLTIAEQNNLKIFQMSVTQDSDEFFPILKNKPGIKYSKTNFVETMGMFIHSSLMPTVIDFWNSYDIYCGWGFDKVLCDITKCDGAVIHSTQMLHPKKVVSSYDKKEAFAEMDKVLYEIAPKFIRDRYNEEWKFVDRQFEKELVMEIK